MKLAKFITEVELEEQDTGGLGFECDEPGHRHGDFPIHYVSPGERPVRIALHPLHKSRKCVCYSGSSRKGRVCKVPNWYYQLGGVSPWAAEIALYQSGFGGIGKISFAQRKHLSEHVMVGKSEGHVGRVLKELDRLGAKRIKQYRRASLFRLPAKPPEGIATLRDDCATPARVNLQAVRKESPRNLLESQVHVEAVTGARRGSQGCTSRQSGVHVVIDSGSDSRSDAEQTRSPAVIDAGSISDSHANTAMKGQAAIFLDALVRAGARFAPRPEGGEGAFKCTVPPEALTPDLERAMVVCATTYYRDELRRLVAERGLCRVG